MTLLTRESALNILRAKKAYFAQKYGITGLGIFGSPARVRPGLPDRKPLRQLLAREPGLTGKGLSPKPGQVSDEVPM